MPTEFKRDGDPDIPQLSLQRLKDIDQVTNGLSADAKDSQIYLFLGRSVAWPYEAIHYKIKKDYLKGNTLNIKQMYFSGGSTLKNIEDKMYTPEQEQGYRSYARSIGITPRKLAENYQEIVLTDFILRGRTMKVFLKLLRDWAKEEEIGLPPISFLDITFSSSFSDIHDHKKLFGTNLRQIIVPQFTLNPLIHDQETLEGIGKNNCLVPSFEPKNWTDWSAIKEWRPSEKALKMQRELHTYLDTKYQK